MRLINLQRYKGCINPMLILAYHLVNIIAECEFNVNKLLNQVCSL